MSKEKFKVLDKVLDPGTLRAVYRLASAGYFVDLVSPISSGKEAVVFKAITRDGEYVAVKVYRISTMVFESLWKYIREDPRFANLGGSKVELICAWTRKEFRNLMRASNAGVRVPFPLAFRRNVLVMEYIGEPHMPAPRAKDLPPKDPKKWFRIIKDYIFKLVEARIVHGDLSEYNILNYHEEPVIIDWGQAVLFDHPRSFEWLRRDIYNICRWFRKLGVDVSYDDFVGEVFDAVSKKDRDREPLRN